ncbi:MAG: ATP-binding protein [Vulcanimicrobiota bacterium]
MNFQAFVAAWVATQILAERAATPPWGLAASTTLEWLRLETENPVDDILVGTSADGNAYVQAKATLKLSQSSTSDLASAFDQFVRQFIGGRTPKPGTGECSASLDPNRDRLVLATSASSSSKIRVVLPKLLQAMTYGRPPTKDEAKVLDCVRTHIERSWQAAVGTKPSEKEIQALLALVRVHTIDFESETGEFGVKDLLRNVVLEQPPQSEVAWSWLLTQCANMAANRSGAGRKELQTGLIGAGIVLKIPLGHRPDIERLRQFSRATLDALEHLGELRVGKEDSIKIVRACVAALQAAAQEKSVLVVGEPGAGKSGAVYDLARALTEAGRDCLVIAVDRLASESLGQLRTEIGLERDLLETLENWLGPQPGFLIIDALDAARGEAAAGMLRELIRRTAGQNGRWHVVASTRKFDLRYGVELRQLFDGRGPTDFVDPEFNRVRHVNVPLLSEDEIAQATAQSSDLRLLVEQAPPSLRELLRVPFNLRLIAELVGLGVPTDQLNPLRTQLDLLDQYWTYRVIRTDGRGDGREGVLRETGKFAVSPWALCVYSR